MIIISFCVTHLSDTFKDLTILEIFIEGPLNICIPGTDFKNQKEKTRVVQESNKELFLLVNFKYGPLQRVSLIRKRI